jgi:hypothetical protein
MEAKQAADTEPTYPNPKMLTDKPKRILLAIKYLGTLARYFIHDCAAVATVPAPR